MTPVSRNIWSLVRNRLRHQQSWLHTNNCAIRFCNIRSSSLYLCNSYHRPNTIMLQINTNNQLISIVTSCLYYVTILTHTQFIQFTNAAHEIEHAQALQCCIHDARIPVECRKMCDMQQMLHMTSTHMWTRVGNGTGGRTFIYFWINFNYLFISDNRLPVHIFSGLPAESMAVDKWWDYVNKRTFEQKLRAMQMHTQYILQTVLTIYNRPRPV
jgi:hypothetical protein